MCGIAGAVTPGPVSPDRLADTLAVMQARGPDGSGRFAGAVGSAQLCFLHTRLSIVDLDPRSDQPFRKDGLVLIYNGEIYNYPELRRTLTDLGARFTTTGDTEVVLEAYRQWGVGAFRRFEGMWALALYDEAEGMLILSRDRFGEKPLYTWRTPDGFFFASEVKALRALTGRKPTPNLQQLRRYLVNGYKSLYFRRQTFYDEIEECPPGYFIRIAGDGVSEPRRYWELRHAPVAMSLDDAVEGAREHVVRAVDYRLRADVPVAVRLSGGIDSNVILGIAQNLLGRRVAAFSVLEEDPRYDETAAIKDAVDFFQCPHTPVTIPKTGFLERMQRLVAYFDGPLMTISYYLHALVSEAIHDAGYKVSLGGTGADELFTGYYDHYLFWLATQQARPDFEDLIREWQGSYGRFVRNPFLQDPRAFVDRPSSRRHIFLGAERFAGFLSEPFDESHAEHFYCGDLLRNRMLNELMVETVPVMLHEDDLASMAYSVENRAVYLDGGLAEFLFSVPTEHLVGGGLPKAILRRIGGPVASPSIMANPRKQGINAPIADLLDLDDPDTRAYMLDASPLYDVVRRDKVDALLKDKVTANSESKFLFSLISAKMFLESAA